MRPVYSLTTGLVLAIHISTLAASAGIIVTSVRRDGIAVPVPDEHKDRAGLPATSLSTKARERSTEGVSQPAWGKEGTNSVKGLLPGETVANPIVITSLPYTDSRTTVGYANDYDETCPYTAPGGPDVVYSFAPSSTGYIAVDLCAAGYDSKVFLYANSVTPGSPYACNDDYCGDIYLQSFVGPVMVTSGSTYYIVVDGFGTNAGAYQLDVTVTQACVWAGCDPGAQPEGEPCSTDADSVNGGCNFMPNEFSQMTMNQSVCGTIWADALERDLDWYIEPLTAGQSVTWRVRANFPFSVGVFDLTTGCQEELFGVREDGNPCEELAVGVTVTATGEYTFLVTTREQFGGYTCAGGPWEYNAELTGVCACDCHADAAGIPGCDGVIDVADVVVGVNVAFRNGAAVADPNPACPRTRTDVNCDGVTDVADVVAMVAVAFRGGNPSSFFCDPCL